MGAQLLNEHLAQCEMAAASPWGPIRLSLSWGQLMDAQGLVQQLAHWCGAPLVFQIRSGPMHAGHSDVTATVCDARLAPVWSKVTIPRALLKATTPPLPLQGAAIQWPSMSFMVEIASLDEAAIEPAHVQEGGLTLLPHAFQSPWVVHLVQEQSGCMMIGHLRLDPGVIELKERVPAQPEISQDCLLAQEDWSVQLARPLVMDLPTAMGWVPGADVIALDYSCEAMAQTDYGLSVRLVHRRKGLQLAGLVVPVMMGAALRLRPVTTYL